MYSLLFCIANEILHVNSTHIGSLGMMLGFDQKQMNDIRRERENKPFNDFEDLKKRIRIGKNKQKELQKLIKDGIITF